MKLNFPLVGGTDEYTPRDVSAETCYNLYAEIVNEKPILKSSPACVNLVDLTSVDGYGKIRGQFNDGNGKVYFVTGSALCVTDGSTVSKLYDIGESSTPVSIVSNGWHIVVADGTAIYTYNIDSTVVTAPSLDFLNPSMLVYFGGLIYAICDDPNQSGGVARNDNRIWYCNDGPTGANTWGALDYYVAEGCADGIVSIILNQGELQVNGSSSIEFWRATGDIDDPLTTARGVNTDIGSSARWSCTGMTDKTFFIGSGKSGDGRIFMSVGYDIKAISTTAIEQWINAQSSIVDCVAFSHKWLGHEWVYFSFNDADRTLVYDVTTGLWHDRYTYENDPNYHKWHYLYSDVLNGYVITFSDDYKICTLSDSSYEENDGTLIVRERTLSHLEFDTEQFIVEDLILSLETGMANTADVVLYKSYDGARTWSTGISLSAGQLGQYGKRLRWRKLSSFTQKFTIRLRMSDPVQWTLLGLTMHITKSVNR